MSEKKKDVTWIMSHKEWFRRIELIEPEIDKLKELMEAGVWIKAYKQISLIDEIVSDMRSPCPRKLDTDIYLELPHY